MGKSKILKEATNKPSNDTAKMATSTKEKEQKGKKPKDKDGEKKSSKKAEEVQQPVEEEPPIIEAEEIVEEEITEIESAKEEEQTPPPIEIYEGPILTDVIIESFEGEKVNGLFEGEGFMKFIDGHTYQGQFSNGLMHGHGCYKWVDGVTYEGDFDQNRISGKGLYTYPDGSSYEGEVLEGKRHGYGVYRFKDNTITYSGQWYMGRKHGKGHLQYDSEGISFYEGDWVNDLFHGWGKRRYPSRNEYQGMWFNSQRHIDGTMKWIFPENTKCSELYNGQWREGVQHGFGEHIWITYRLPGTQFNTRNSYIGQFVNGMKHGKGIFQYADGAKYEGEWYEDMKHGQAKFTQRTGEIYTGLFINNRLPPNTVIPGLPSLFYGKPCLSSDSEKNVTEINFLLDLEELLKNYPEVDKKLELEQVSKNIWRHISSLKGIYGFYSRIGCEESADNVYLMSNFQYWRFLKDCRFHHYGYTLTEMDRIIEKFKSPTKMHNPFTKILQREFIANLIILSFHLYHKKYMSAKERFKLPRCMLDWCFSQLLKNNVFPFACQVKGHFYDELRKAMNVFEHIDKVYPIYKSLCEQQKHSFSDLSFRMRDFLFLLKDINLINEDLTTDVILKILEQDDPTIIEDGCYNLELEMTFLEFIEALVGCAEVYVTESIVESVSSFHQELGVIIPFVQQYTSSPGLLNVESSSSNLVAGASHTFAVPAAATTETESVTPVGAAIKSPSSATSPPQAVPTAASTPVVGSPELSLLDNVQLSLESDTKIIDITKVPEVHVSLSQEELENEKDEPVEEYGEPSSEDLDQATKKYNFWTHQVHIFFIQKFIGPAQELLEIRHTARLKAGKEIKHHKKMKKSAAFLAEHAVKSVKGTPSSVSSSPTENHIVEAEPSEAGIMPTT